MLVALAVEAVVIASDPEQLDAVERQRLAEPRLEATFRYIDCSYILPIVVWDYIIPILPPWAFPFLAHVRLLAL